MAKVAHLFYISKPKKGSRMEQKTEAKLTLTTTKPTITMTIFWNNIPLSIHQKSSEEKSDLKVH